LKEGLLGRGPVHYEGHEKRAEDAEDRAEGSADQPFQTDLFEPDLEENDAAAQDQPASSGEELILDAKRMKKISGPCEHENENDTDYE
jgi:hypothetical protein